MTERGVTQVVLQACPIDLLERARYHNEALLREFAFIMESEEDRSSVPARLLAVVDQIRSHIAGLNEGTEGQIDRARERGDATLDLHVVLPTDGREVAVALKALFDEAEEYCRRGDLLTLAEPADVSAFRDWYLQQYVEQIDGAPPTPWTPSRMPGS
jgi:hypothetical protein